MLRVIFVSLFMFFSLPAFAGLRAITGDVDDPQGSGCNGSMIITSPNYVSVDGVFKAATTRHIALTDGAYTAFSLDSSQDATPAFSYLVEYRCGAAQPAPRCSWSIPAGSTSVTIVSIQSCPAIPGTPGGSVPYSNITGLTTCAVPFGGTSGSMTIDATNFCWDNTNKRLGIGDNTPSTTLDITSPTVAAVTVTRGASQSTNRMFSFRTAASDIMSEVDSYGTMAWFSDQAKKTVAVGSYEDTTNHRGAFLLSTLGDIKWKSVDNIDSAGSWDTGFSRNAAGIVEVNNGVSGTYRDLKLRNMILTDRTEPTCDSSTRGQFNTDQGGAGVADTVRVCVKLVDDTYDWRPIL